jgi:diaminopimelate decarboxylase
MTEAPHHRGMNPFAPDLLRSLARAHGTPLWVYDAATIRQRIAELRAFDTIRYAQKANSNTHLLRLMREAGVVVDAVSRGEIERALAAGFSPAPDAQGAAGIVFTADLFDPATLDTVVRHGVTVNAGSIDMLDQLGAVSPATASGCASTRASATATATRPTPAASTASTASGTPSCRSPGCGGPPPPASGGPAHAHRLGRGLRPPAAGLRRHGGPGQARRVAIEAISAGGGLSIPYRDGEPRLDTAHYFQLWDAARREIASHLGRDVHLELEPGRYLVAESGVLLTEVRATKHMGRQRFTLVDAGFSDLMRPAMYGAYHGMSLLPADDSPRAEVDTVVAGPLCESGDVFTQADGGVVLTRRLPEARVGDLLVLHDAGPTAPPCPATTTPAAWRPRCWSMGPPTA